MPSNSKSVRELQKKHYETAVQNRLAVLKEKGMASAAIQKDTRLKQLRAKVRKIQKALAAISAIEKKNEELALRKKEKAERKPEEEEKGKKKGKGKKSAPKAEKKAKKEKKKKQG